MASRKIRDIRIAGARQNNLQNVDVDFPLKKLTVITGVSGSGKSSLAFETLYAEGQRRYVESLSTYTRQFLEKMPKPLVDSVENIPPSIALEQRNSVINSRSTVGTQTEIVDYLRVLFSRIGKTHCLNCDAEVKKIDKEMIVTQISKKFAGKKLAIVAPLRWVPKKKLGIKAFREEFCTLILGQGYRRLLLGKEILDLEDPENQKKIRPTKLKDKSTGIEVQLFVDRLALPKKIDTEARTRLFDSIGQALHLGHDQAGSYDFATKKLQIYDCRFACPECGREHPLPDPQLFSFNSPLGACGHCSGFGFTLDLDESRVVPDPTKTLKNGAIDPLAKPSMEEWQDDLFRFSERHGISVGKRYSELNQTQKNLIWNGHPNDSTFPGIVGCFKYLARKKYKLHVRVFIRRYQSQTLCTECGGARLQKESLAVKIHEKSIAEILEMSITQALNWFVATRFTKKEEEIGEDLIAQLRKRLEFLEGVGVGYLTLSRLAKSLSGGEFQRISLATQLGNGLCGTLYVLDEPSIGLHSADTERMIRILQSLRDQGNTVVVVEHDLDVIRSADFLVELGPGAGRNGGEILAKGSPRELAAVKGSVTGKYIKGDFTLQPRAPRPTSTSSREGRSIRLSGCRENNLNGFSVDFPLERFVVVTGVSGSGKSTLVHQTLYEALFRCLNTGTLGVTQQRPVGRFDRLYGAEHLSGVVLMDQKPIGKTSRSNPATYLKAWDEVRRIYANQVLSLRRGYTPQHFSFNVEGGRCPVCKGEGEITLDMHFMAEVTIPCEECSGKRFKKGVLDVSYRGKNLHQLLSSTIDEAYDLFRDNPILMRKLGILRDVGLGYLQLGQPGNALSGGESQRLKVASVLDQNHSDGYLYIFDEPTTGLHLEDIKKLLLVLQDLVSAKNSIIMIEHHLDVIAQADWVIDLGPGGGINGGSIVAEGCPADLLQNRKSATGRALAKSFDSLQAPRTSTMENGDNDLLERSALRSKSTNWTRRPGARR